MNLKMIVLAVFCASALCSTSALADSDSKDHKKSEWREKMDAKKEEIFKDLNLTDEQKEALKANKEKNREARKTLSQAMRDKMKLMREELQKDNLDMGKINQIQADLKSAQAQMLDQRLEGILEVRKILTLEQFKKFSDKMEEHRKEFRGKFGERHWGDRNEEPSGGKSEL
jgi:Spy/CpxP family protein refolding chaperone